MAAAASHAICAEDSCDFLFTWSLRTTTRYARSVSSRQGRDSVEKLTRRIYPAETTKGMQAANNKRSEHDQEGKSTFLPIPTRATFQPNAKPITDPPIIHVMLWTILR
jgi:hypothetical protein